LFNPNYLDLLDISLNRGENILKFLRDSVDGSKIRIINFY